MKAGKKLAEYNKLAKEALAREMKREREAEVEEAKVEGSSQKAWIPELSFTAVLSIVGIAFTAIDMYMRFRSKPPKVEQKVTPQPSKIPVPQPKIGMH